MCFHLVIFQALFIFSPTSERYGFFLMISSVSFQRLRRLQKNRTNQQKKTVPTLRVQRGSPFTVFGGVRFFFDDLVGFFLMFSAGVSFCESLAFWATSGRYGFFLMRGPVMISSVTF